MILDLTNSKNSQIEYVIDKYPDGQQSFHLLIPIEGTYRAILKNDPAVIKSRMSNFMDVELIIAATQALRNIGVEKIRLFVPYFIGARSDRKFEYGGINYLKQVIAPIINSQGYENVFILDPHSDVLEAVINNFEKSTLDSNLISFALQKIDNKSDARERTVFISPDAGAVKRVYQWAKQYNIENFLVGEKVRDIKTGKIIHSRINGLEDFTNDHNFVIIDDICDGGRTFIELAKKIKEVHPNANISLIVTHGIFSAGLEPFKGFIDQIYTTNSYRDINSTNEFGMINEKYLDIVKQINVF